MRGSLIAAVAWGLCSAVSVARADDEWSARERFICRSSTEVREIKTYVSAAPQGNAPGGLECRVDYTKNGTTQTLWSSRTSRNYCDGKASQLAARLRSGNFSCESLGRERAAGG